MGDPIQSRSKLAQPQNVLPNSLRRVFEARTGSEAEWVKSLSRIRNPPNNMGSKVHLTFEDFGFVFHVARTAAGERAHKAHRKKKREK